MTQGIYMLCWPTFPSSQRLSPTFPHSHIPVYPPIVSLVFPHTMVSPSGRPPSPGPPQLLWPTLVEPIVILSGTFNISLHIERD